MNSITFDILGIIDSYTRCIDTILLYRVCKSYMNLLENKKKQIESRRHEIYFLYNETLINLMGGINYMLEYPILKWDEKFLGDTNYIDRIPVKCITDKIMRGVDSYGRAFITLRLYDENNTYYKSNTYVCVLFQRYSDIKTSWAHSTTSGINILGDSSHFIIDNKLTNMNISYNIYNLLHNKGFIYMHKYNPPGYKPLISTINGIRLI